MNRHQKDSTIIAFLEGRKESFQFGSLVGRGGRIYTYGVLLAFVCRSHDDHGHVVDLAIELNTKNYSVTSSRHKNLVEHATKCCDRPTEVTIHPDGLPEIFQ